MDVTALLDWHRQGFSFAEIGHRLGLSGERVRELLAEQGLDVDATGDRQDDHKPNDDAVR